MSELLQNSEIVFHTAATELYHEMPPDHHFGILNLKIGPSVEPIAKNIAIVFTIDCSASMTDRCSDNRTKLEHAKYTMIGILSFLAENSEQSVSVAVVTFSKKLYPIFNFTKITPENLDEYIQKIQNIKTKECTNIENALREADRTLTEFSTKNPTAALYHIQLTDGEVTDGENDHTKLANMVNTNYTNIFVGFGKNHDDELLCKLAENPRNEYRFVDKIEFSSIVYGEILYNILYLVFDKLVVTVPNGEIYDWRTNSWNKTLVVNNIPYDSERIFQLRSSSKPYDVEAEIATAADEPAFATVYCYPDLIQLRSNEDRTKMDLGVPNGNHLIQLSLTECQTKMELGVPSPDPHDLTTYSFRQRTQELLYEVRSFIQKQNAEKKSKKNNYVSEPEKPCLNANMSEKMKIYNKCQDFIKKIKTYMELNNIKNDHAMKLLQDDIYIIMNTLFCNNAHMWCTTRQQSLGQNHSYQPTDFAESEDFLESTIRMPKMRRSQACTYPLFDRDTATAAAEPYELSQNFDFATMSPSMARAITAVSSPSL